MSCDLLSWKAAVKQHEPAVCSLPENTAAVPSVLRKVCFLASLPECVSVSRMSIAKACMRMPRLIMSSRAQGHRYEP